MEGCQSFNIHNIRILTGEFCAWNTSATAVIKVIGTRGNTSTATRRKSYAFVSDRDRTISPEQVTVRLTARASKESFWVTDRQADGTT
ncbi:hypothetical protein J6590_042728 [Homalodisca vitripennis]|nr:hypothetical protein J6590_042728 [Homalodisca vitripennis]